MRALKGYLYVLAVYLANQAFAQVPLWVPKDRPRNDLCLENGPRYQPDLYPIKTPPGMSTGDAWTNRSYFVRHFQYHFLQNNRGGEVINLRAFLNHYRSQFTQNFQTGLLVGKNWQAAELQSVLEEGGQKIDRLNEVASNISAYRAGGPVRDLLSKLAAGVGFLPAPHASATSTVLNLSSSVLFNLADRAGAAEAQEEARAQLVKMNGLDVLNDSVGQDLFLIFNFFDCQRGANQPNNTSDLEIAFNNYYASKLLGVTPSTPYTEIIEKNPNLRQEQADSKLESKIKDVEVAMKNPKLTSGNQQEVNESVRELFEKISNMSTVLNESNKLLLQMFNSRSDPNRSGSNEDQQRRLVEAQLAQSQATFFGALGIVSFFNPELGSKIGKIYQGHVRLIDLSTKFSAGSIGTVAYGLGVAGVCLEIFSTLTSNEAAANAAFQSGVMKSFEALGAMVHDLRAEMREHFLAVDKRIDGLFDQLDLQIKAVREGQSNLGQSLALVSAQIDASRRELNFFGSHMATSLRNLMSSPLNQEIDFALNYHLRVPNDILPFDKFLSAVSKFTLWGADLSSQDPYIVTDATHRLSSLNDLYSIDRMRSITSFGGNAFGRINTLADAAGLLLDEPSLRPSSPLPNGIVFATGAKAYLELYRRWQPVYERSASGGQRYSAGGDFIRLKKTAERLDQTFARIFSNVQGEDQENLKIWTRLGQQHDLLKSSYFRVLQSAQDTQLAKSELPSLIDRGLSLDPAELYIERPSAEKAIPLRVWKSFSQPADAELPFSVVKALLPTDVRRAEQLQIGTLSAEISIHSSSAIMHEDMTAPTSRRDGALRGNGIHLTFFLNVAERYMAQPQIKKAMDASIGYRNYPVVAAGNFFCDDAIPSSVQGDSKLKAQWVRDHLNEVLTYCSGYWRPTPNVMMAELEFFRIQRLRLALLNIVVDLGIGNLENLVGELSSPASLSHQAMVLAHESWRLTEDFVRLYFGGAVPRSLESVLTDFQQKAALGRTVISLQEADQLRAALVGSREKIHLAINSFVDGLALLEKRYLEEELPEDLRGLKPAQIGDRSGKLTLLVALTSPQHVPRIRAALQRVFDRLATPQTFLLELSKESPFRELLGIRLLPRSYLNRLVLEPEVPDFFSLLKTETKTHRSPGPLELQALMVSLDAPF